MAETKNCANIYEFGGTIANKCMFSYVLFLKTDTCAEFWCMYMCVVVCVCIYYELGDGIAKKC